MLVYNTKIYQSEQDGFLRDFCVFTGRWKTVSVKNTCGVVLCWGNYEITCILQWKFTAVFCSVGVVQLCITDQYFPSPVELEFSLILLDSNVLL